MIIEAICENGIVRMPSGLKYQHNSFKVKVELPDQEVSEGRNVVEKMQTSSSQPAIEITEIHNSDAGNQMLNRFEQILGPYRKQLAKWRSFTEQDYKEMRYEHLEEKYLGRTKTSDS